MEDRFKEWHIEKMVAAVIWTVVGSVLFLFMMVVLRLGEWILGT